MRRDDPLVIPTRVAHAGHVDHGFFGHQVYADLAGRISLTGLVALGINGRRLTEDEARMLDDIAAVWTIADPRIWPLKVSRLASSFGGPLQGYAASLLCQDCRYVGIWQSSPAAARWLVELQNALGNERKEPAELDQLIHEILSTKRYLPGFGVPYREADERVPPMWRCLEARHRHELPYVRLFARVAELARRERGLNPNIAGLAAAICLDLGFDAEEIGTLLIALGTHMFVANVHEGARHAPAVLRRLPDDRVRYVGPSPRVSPRRERAES